jgi:hypothetical protein
MIDDTYIRTVLRLLCAAAVGIRPLSRRSLSRPGYAPTVESEATTVREYVGTPLHLTAYGIRFIPAPPTGHPPCPGQLSPVITGGKFGVGSCSRIRKDFRTSTHAVLVPVLSR